MCCVYFRSHLDLVQATQAHAFGTRHVKAHTGPPWNERADKLVGATSWRRSPSCFLPPLITSESREGALRQHAAAMLSLRGCVVPALVEDSLPLAPTDPPSLPATLVCPALAKATGGGQEVSFALTVTQANVLPMGPDTRATGLLEGGKALHLARQCAQRDVHVAFLQGARTEGPATRSSGPFHVIGSGCALGRQDGAEIWISTEG